MPLKATITHLADVPGALREFYRKMADGTYAIVLDGEPPGYVKADKLAEFRANNRALNAAKAELEARLAAFDGIDPERARAALADVDDLEQTHADAIGSLKAELAERSKRAEGLEAELNAERFRNLVSVEFLRAGGRESAVDFMVANAGKTFTMQDGKPTTKEFSPARPGEPLTVEEWVKQQMGVVGFAFKPSRGGGAPPNSGYVPGARPTVSRDPVEFGRNIAGIASGDITVE